MLLPVLFAVAVAAETPTPALVALEAGDAAYFAGDRRDGVRGWREALARADDSPAGRAAEVMARLRLLRAGTTLSPLWQGPRIERALAACTTGAWCRLAAVDYDLFAPEGIGDRDRGLAAARSLAGELPAHAASRVAWATGDPAPVRAVAEAERDGLGRAIVAGLAPEPGPAVIGVGVLAGPPAGIGAGVRWVDVDVGRIGVRVTADAFVARRAAGLAAAIETPGTVGAVASVQALRWPWWDGDAYTPVDTARLAPGAVVRAGRARLQAGPLLRWDADPVPVAGHGGWWATSLDMRRAGRARAPTGLWLGVSGEVSDPLLADYARVGVVGDARVYLGLGAGVVATRARGEGAMGAFPDIRRPTVGGSDVLRGARYGELRGDFTVAGDVEVRHPVVGPLWGAAFATGAAVEGRGAHAGGGVGVRLVLPPEPRNTLRLDVAATDVGWGVIVAWGEAF